MAQELLLNMEDDVIEDYANEAEAEHCITRKCGLARLGCKPYVLDCFDTVSCIMQRYAVYGSLFANHYFHYIFERDLKNGANITNQTFWVQILNKF